MIIDRVKIDKYHFLQDIDVEVQETNILIGENGTGKTTFLNAIKHQYPEAVWWTTSLKTKSEQELLLCLKDKIILLENPENGFHHSRLGEIAKLFWKVKENGCQIFCTTHSPYLPDHFNPENILLFYNKPEKTIIVPFKYCDVDRYMGEYQLGELWTGYGEGYFVRQYEKHLQQVTENSGNSHSKL